MKTIALQQRERRRRRDLREQEVTVAEPVRKWHTHADAQAIVMDVDYRAQALRLAAMGPGHNKAVLETKTMDELLKKQQPVKLS